MEKESINQKIDLRKFLRMWDRKTMKLWLRAVRSFNIYQVDIPDRTKNRERGEEIIFKKITPENFLEIN